MDKEQWHLLWTGKQAFWQAVPRLLASSPCTVERLTEPRKSSTGQPCKIPRLMAAQDGECTQLLRICCRRVYQALPKGHEGSPNAGLGASRSIEGHTKKLEGEVQRLSTQHVSG